MNNIKFEGLGMEFNINPIFLEIGNLKIYWYAICIIIGILISLLLCKKDDGKYNIKFDDIIELIIIILPISIIGARVYYVLFKLDYYKENILDIFKINNGGLAIYGGIIAGIVVTFIFCKIKKIKFLDMVDYLAPYLPLGQCIGRWGNFFNIEAYGTETSNLFRMGIIEKGKYIEVHPTFLYESFCTFLIFIYLFNIRNKRKYEGELTFKYLFIYGIIRATIEGIRTDSLMIGNIRISQILSIITSVIFGIIIFYNIDNVKSCKKS